MYRWNLRRWSLLLAPALLVVATSTFTVAPTPTPTPAPGRVAPAIGVRPNFRPVGRQTASGTDVAFDCQRADAEYPCYGPAQVRQAYRVDPLLKRGLNGAGHTIVIVDAFQNPFARQELHDFDAAFGLPDPPRFDIIAPQGLTPWDPNDFDMVGWSGEISLDVQWAHSIAPGANIVLALSRSDEDPDITRTLDYVVSHNVGDVISMSFGEGQTCLDPRIEAKWHSIFREATAKRITLVSSSGDSGVAQFSCDGSDAQIFDVSTPAADPLVLGVGGTNLSADFVTGQYGSEVGWAGSGGGFSTLYPRPDYQLGAVRNRGRGVPDVSYNAGDPNSFIVAWYAFEGPGVFVGFFGTSAGAPEWAGLTAITDQIAGRRVGRLNDRLYFLGEQTGTRATSTTSLPATTGRRTSQASRPVATGTRSQGSALLSLPPWFPTWRLADQLRNLETTHTRRYVPPTSRETSVGSPRMSHPSDRAIDKGLYALADRSDAHHAPRLRCSLRCRCATWSFHRRCSLKSPGQSRPSSGVRAAGSTSEA